MDLDSKTGGNQVFGAQSVGVLNQFPAIAYIYVMAPGTFVFLDGGSSTSALSGTAC